MFITSSRRILQSEQIFIIINAFFSDGELKSFGFSLLGKGMAEWANRAVFVSSVRKVLSDHPEFNATLFDVDSPVLSLILTVCLSLAETNSNKFQVRNDLIGSIAVTVACMAIVCLFFVSSRVGVLIITFIITSICYCTFIPFSLYLSFQVW